MDAFYMTLDSAEFRFYSCPEILQLSVKEIKNAQTFDLLENPVIGGLHDPALGPLRYDDRCDSCGQSERNCPGHFGHIRLPVLLFNPVLFRTLITLLEGTCMSCHKVMLPSHIIQGYVIVIMLLRKGLISEAQDIMENFVKGDKCTAEIEAGLKRSAKKYKRVKVDGKVNSKHILTLLKSTVAVIYQNLKASCRKCLHCQCKNRRLKGENHRTIIGTFIKKIVSDDDKDAKKKSQDLESEVNAEPTQEEAPSMIEEEIEMDGDDAEEELNIKKEVEEVLEEEINIEMQTEIDQFIKSPHERCILSPYVARLHLKQVWIKEKEFLKAVFPFLAQVPGLDAATDVFFLDIVPVSPSRFRPVNMMKGIKYEHHQTTKLSKIISECDVLSELLAAYSKNVQMAKEDNVEGLTLPESDENSMRTMMQNIMSSWLRVQTIVNTVLDGTLDKYTKETLGGVRQVLEKKEGLFRMNMMGKRVNFAARSVISPDPYISVNQIGVPLVFASKLTYPQPVTPWNVHLLRQLIINGPNKYPGAFSVINEDGCIVRLSSKDETQREAIANQLLVPDQNLTGHKIVNRHLLNGDYLLMNRQPTLHRPSIQAHKARVLGGIKTLRLHYSNCKAYNADFDGDEMNVHFPQDELGRAEAATLACTDFQYLVPKDGTPLGGLIQDHMVAGVALTTRGRFFNKRDFCGLLWGAMNDWQEKLDLPPPAIFKPVPLWSGKQIISAILLNIIPKDQAPLNLNSRAKIPEKNWVSPECFGLPNMTPLNLKAWCSEEMGESTVVFRQGELLQGVLDKAHYGPSTYGLVHCCYELYGGVVAGKLLTYLGRLFTTFLQMVGFSLGVGDILVLKKANKKRKSIIKKANLVGRQAVTKALSWDKEQDMDDTDVLEEIKKAHFDKDGLKMAEIDMCMKGETDQIQDSIAKSIMPRGLEKKFPENSLQLMVQSGAKGSPVNCMQISCLLGQIELEGRRPPLMMSGRSLPCFLPYDVSPQAGGFVTGRFLTGIRPSEYFFHCMAGREGLIDTAVKTSRSGYLQRCLVKHLEGIMVNYDLTVRDSDGGVLQFYYGEDGVEATRSSYLKPSQFPFLTENLAALQNGTESPWLSPNYSKSVRRTWKKISKWRADTNEKGFWMNRESGFHHFCNNEPSVDLSEDDKKTLVKTGKFKGHSEASKKCFEAWFDLDVEKRTELLQSKSCPDPVMSKHLPHSQPDVLSEKFKHLVNVYCKKGLENVKSSLPRYASIDQDMFKTAVNKKLVQSLAHPGEAVGLLCAQSVGEPSTQMTLNTFHFAGRGEMNVTLGIPRLREILMTGAKMPKTPQVDVPIRPIPNAREKAERLRAQLNRVTLDQVLEYVHVKSGFVNKNSRNYTNIEMKFKCLRHSHYRHVCNWKYKSIVEYIVKHFIPIIELAIKKEIRILKKSTLLTSGQMKRSSAKSHEGENEEQPTAGQIRDEDEEANDEPNDGDAATVKEQQRLLDTTEYEGEDEERKEVDDDEDAEADEVMLEEAAEEEEEESDAEEDGDTNEEKHVAIEDLSQEYHSLLKKAQSHDTVIDMKFSAEKKRSFTVTFQYRPQDLEFDLRLLFVRLIKTTVIQQIPGIKQAFVTEESEDGETVLHLKTDGINIQHLFNFPEILDLNRMYTNSIEHMCNIYGIEAANRVIIKEVQNVFGAYGITVDYHHLSLLADYMTSRGGYDACSRFCIDKNQTSPFQKITFETSMSFLMDACLNGHKDHLKSPSAQIVTGKPIGVGTGCFEILGRH